jgi:hypothetical protein
VSPGYEDRLLFEPVIAWEIDEDLAWLREYMLPEEFMGRLRPGTSQTQVIDEAKIIML